MRCSRLPSERRPGGNWWAQIQHLGRRERLSLGSPAKAAAAARARDLYHAVVSKGWDAALAELMLKRNPGVTIGDFLGALRATSDLNPKTLEGYGKAFRKIVTDAFHIQGEKEKSDYRGGGYRPGWKRLSP